MLGNGSGDKSIDIRHGTELETVVYHTSSRHGGPLKTLFTHGQNIIGKACFILMSSK